MFRRPTPKRTRTFFWGPPLVFGSTLLAIALLFVYPLVFLEFVPVLLFLLGLALTLAGTQPWWLKGLGILVPVGLPVLGLYLFFHGGLTRPEHAVVLLPAAFRGEVDIVQNEQCGAWLPRPDGQLTLRIPLVAWLLPAPPWGKTCWRRLPIAG